MNKVESLIEQRKNIELKKWQFYKNFQECDNDIKEIEKNLYVICKHDWENDYSSCGPSDRPDKVCKICNLIRNDYIYK